MCGAGEHAVSPGRRAGRSRRPVRHCVQEQTRGVARGGADRAKPSTAYRRGRRGVQHVSPAWARLVWWADCAHRLLSHRVRRAAGVALGRGVRGARCAVPDAARAGLEPARLRDRTAPSGRARGDGRLRRVHAALGRAHGRLRLRGTGPRKSNPQRRRGRPHGGRRRGRRARGRRYGTRPPRRMERLAARCRCVDRSPRGERVGVGRHSDSAGAHRARCRRWLGRVRSRRVRGCGWSRRGCRNRHGQRSRALRAVGAPGVPGAPGSRSRARSSRSGVARVAPCPLGLASPPL